MDYEKNGKLSLQVCFVTNMQSIYKQLFRYFPADPINSGGREG
jgi:hypothetical protein